MLFPFYKYFQIIPERELYNLAIHPENGIFKIYEVFKKEVVYLQMITRENTLLNVFQRELLICGNYQFYGAMRCVKIHYGWIIHVIPIIRQNNFKIKRHLKF